MTQYTNHIVQSKITNKAIKITTKEVILVIHLYNLYSKFPSFMISSLGYGALKC